MTFAAKKYALELRIGTLKRAIKVRKLVEAPTKLLEDRVVNLTMQLTEHLRSKQSAAAPAQSAPSVRTR